MPASDYHVPNLERALSLLELLAQQPAGLSLSELTAALDVPLNSVFRITATLVQRGYLRRDEDSKRFILARKLLSLGYAAVGAPVLLEVALPVMRQLRDELGETVLLGVLTHHEGVVLAVVPGTFPVTVQVSPGTRFPLHTAAPGKALLAALPAAARAAALAALPQPLPRFTARTLTSKARLARELDAVAARGYAVDHEEEITGINCVGCVLRGSGGEPAAALWITGPAFRLRPRDFAARGQRLAGAAALLACQLGGQPDAS